MLVRHLANPRIYLRAVTWLAGFGIVIHLRHLFTRRLQRGIFMPATTDRLQALRRLMKEHTLQAYFVPSEDAHQSEYIAKWDARREFISGFTGSAGLAIITDFEAALWTDGRYFLQAEKQLDINWKLMKAGIPGTPTQEDYLVKVPKQATHLQESHYCYYYICRC